jgi:hypothetical protein
LLRAGRDYVVKAFGRLEKTVSLKNMEDIDNEEEMDMPLC